LISVGIAVLTCWSDVGIMCCGYQTGTPDIVVEVLVHLGCIWELICSNLSTETVCPAFTQSLHPHSYVILGQHRLYISLFFNSTSIAEVKERVELYLYSPSGP